MILPQIFINSLIAGAIYALVAVGFSLVYSMQKFFHVAHGAIYVAGAFVAWWLTAKVEVPLYLAFLAAIIACIGVGLIIDFFLYRPLRPRKDAAWSLFLVSFAAFLFIQNLILLLFGADVKTFGLQVEKGLEFGNIIITPIQIMIIAVAVAIIGLLHLFLQKTKIGKVMRATADDETIAKLSGIDADRVSLITICLGSALAGIAGILVALEQNLEHAMGLSAILKGITAAIVGGVGNVGASIFGALFLGLAENFGILFLPSGYKDAIAFVVLGAFLLFRPEGFFGIKVREK